MNPLTRRKKHPENPEPPENPELPVQMEIGSQVTVTIDRPLGSTHPKYPNTHYLVNYGHVKGVMAADGEEQDAYLLGVDEPVNEYTGILIAIIHRLDDVEDKWVVVPVGRSYTKEEILKQVAFQEKYFHIEIQME